MSRSMSVGVVVEDLKKIVHQASGGWRDSEGSPPTTVAGHSDIVEREECYSECTGPRSVVCSYVFSQMVVCNQLRFPLTM